MCAPGNRMCSKKEKKGRNRVGRGGGGGVNCKPRSSLCGGWKGETNFPPAAVTVICTGKTMKQPIVMMPF